MAAFVAPWLFWASSDGPIKSWFSWRVFGIALGGWLMTILCVMPFVVVYALLRSTSR